MFETARCDNVKRTFLHVQTLLLERLGDILLRRGRCHMDDVSDSPLLHSFEKVDCLLQNLRLARAQQPVVALLQNVCLSTGEQ